MTDRTLRITLIVIALGVWANFWAIYQPAKDVSNEIDTLSQIEDSLTRLDVAVDDIKDNVEKLKGDVSDVADGTCVNLRLCR